MNLAQPGYSPSKLFLGHEHAVRSYLAIALFLSYSAPWLGHRPESRGRILERVKNFSSIRFRLFSSFCRNCSYSNHFLAIHGLLPHSSELCIVMTRVVRLIALALILLMVIPGVMLPTVRAADIQDRDFSPAVGVKTVDEFGYRLSFRMEDGVEVLSMRATFKVMYFYSQQFSTDPLTRRHSMYALVGFYYGKTMLGRSVISSVLTDYIAFYPKWHDSAGYPHDLLSITPMFMLNDTISDGQLAGRTMVLDEKAIASYIPSFGGTFAFSGLTLVMGDGSEVRLSDEIVLVRVEKYNNEIYPRDAVLLNEGSVGYTSDSDYFTATLDGVAPWFVAFDAVLAITLWGTLSMLIVLGSLHAKGRIRLPLHKLRRIGASKDVSP